jgi:hypothetical protein
MPKKAKNHWLTRAAQYADGAATVREPVRLFAAAACTE